MAWSSQGLITDPTSGQILADTGELSAGSTTFTVAIYNATGVNMILLLQHRNALNTATLHTQKMYVPPGSPSFLFQFPVVLVASERIRAVNDTALTGDVQVSIFSSL